MLSRLILVIALLAGVALLIQAPAQASERGADYRHDRYVEAHRAPVSYGPRPVYRPSYYRPAPAYRHTPRYRHERYRRAHRHDHRHDHYYRERRW